MSDLTTTYRVEILIGKHSPLVISWPTKYAGRPTEANLAAFIALDESVNDYKATSAEIIRQNNGDTEATYTA